MVNLRDGDVNITGKILMDPLKYRNEKKKGSGNDF